MAIKINGKDYDENTFDDKTKNYVIARQELVQNRARLEVEAEKIEVLIRYYNAKICEFLGIDPNVKTPETTEEVKTEEKKQEMAAIANLRIDQGTTFSSNVTLAGNDGTAFDLTGHTASAKMAKGYESTKTRTTLTTAIANPATGIITLSLTAAQTSALDAPARYVYDVEVTRTSDGMITRVIEGIITIRPNVTI